METFEKRGIKIPNAVLIQDSTKTETDDEVVHFLKGFGCVRRSEMIDEPESIYHQYIVVEFETGAPLLTLRKILPYTYVCEKERVTYDILDLSLICADDGGKVQTDNYIAGLHKVAKQTGQDFATVLNGVMSLLGQTVAGIRPAAGEGEVSEEDSKGELSSAVNNLLPNSLPSNENPSLNGTAPKGEPDPNFQNPPCLGLPTMSPHELNPPGIRYVVEHIVKSDESTSHYSAQRIRAFSGRTPRPQNESDYDTWRSGIDLLLQDPAVSDLQRSRKIFESLLPPAADVVKHLKPETPPTIYLETLDSAYGTVQDGEELYAKFLDTFQDAGEKPSNYLQRLQVALNLVVKRGGVSGRDTDRHLLTQFCRGCWDNSLITELQLKQRKHNPPTFAEFLLLLRTEEDREAAKAIRMKQHLGSSRNKATAHAQYAYTDTSEKGEIAALTTVTQQLAQQLADIQKQLAALTAAQSSSSSAASKPTFGRKLGEGQGAGKPSKTLPSAPKPGYCYRCGEDGHIRPNCENPPNSALVSVRKKQFAEKQEKWQKSNPTATRHLN